MARYCFYCGRELATGEKCNCRTHQSGGSSGASSGASTSASSGASTSASSGTASTGSSSGSTANTSRPSGESASQSSRPSNEPTSGSSRPAGEPAGAAFRGHDTRERDNKQQKSSAWPKFNFNSSFRGHTGARTRAAGAGATSVLADLIRLAGYLTRPVEMIRETVQRVNLHQLRTYLLIHALIGGLAAILINAQGSLELLLQLTIVSSANNPALEAVFLFTQGFGLVLVLDLLMILVAHLVLSTVFRAGFRFNRLAASFVPVIFYQALFWLLAALSMSTSPISALLLLAAGLAVSTLAFFLAMRQLTNYDENRCFMLVALVCVIYTSLIAMLVNLAMPVFSVLVSQSLPL